MGHITVEGVENTLRKALFKNDAHKRALHEKLFGGTALCDEELKLVAGGNAGEETITNEDFKSNSKAGGIL